MLLFLYILCFFFIVVVCFLIKTKIRHQKKTLLPKQLDRSWFANTTTPLTPADYQRSGDQTFLTYPEWFLVFSPAEQALYFKEKTSTTFPYEQHVEQFWDSYALLSEEIKTHFPYNNQYHTMIKVIGYSTMIEYRGKLLYEQSIGRLTALIPSKMTAEDQFYGEFMQRYVNFIQKEPWYLYPFLQEFKQLWMHTTWLEWNIIRKLERRIFISVELLFKAFYGSGLGLGTKSTYGVAAPVTAVLIDQLPPNHEVTVPELKLVDVISNEATLVTLPRYAAFTAALTKLIKTGVQIKEIAGNTSSILLTIVVPIDWQAVTTLTQPIFKQIIPTQPSKQRVALVVLIKDLSTLMLQLEQAQIPIEHIFDY
ncbi:hypothetical protein [Aureispira anguillae]|uniref:Uncharacterized protein n=1 Tax=Aureispira anguillae TaxID=2864201 RepID=A0A916DUM1_9BACT|nr:hypothetical protein [Aureispira anguillae]BDS12655.1 hypothetical protein AsAng_0033790 [Aureispira anguillae]